MPADYRRSALLPIAWDQLHRDSRMLAAAVMAKGPFKGVIAIARGGLVPAAVVARELDLRLVETFCAASYDDQSQGDLKVLRAPSGDGEGWLVVDDLADTGSTAQAVRVHLPKAHIAAVYTKPLGRDSLDTYAVPVEQDVWLLFPWDADMAPTVPLARQI